jgi:purine-binding chemotaxis protein CheW
VTTPVESRALKLVVFDLAGQRYALHLGAVDRVLPMLAVSPLPKAPAIALGVIDLHGTVMPVLDLRRRLGFPSLGDRVSAHLLVARTSRRTVVVPVDQVLEVRELTVEAVTSPDAVLPGIDHVAGIVALPDGLLYIHDLDTLLSLEEERQLTAASEEPVR